MIHLQRELLKRRDKRLELATRKRAFELANVTKRRRTDEDATWSWWKVRAFFWYFFWSPGIHELHFSLAHEGRIADRYYF